MTVEIVPLTPDRAHLFFELFDGEGFADNPGWSGCYCRFYHYDHEGGDWENEPAADNRTDACHLIADGTMRGWIALEGQRPVGWLNAGRKDGYRAFCGDDVPGKASDATGIITCFLVAPSARGKGVARQLLETALEGFRAQGLSWVEAKPAKSPETAASNYHGPLSMYLKHGFEMAGDFSEYQHLVRMAL